MGVDAGTVYSEVRVELSKMDGDVRAVQKNFDQIAEKSKIATLQVSQSWDKVQTAVRNVDKVYQGLSGTHDVVREKQQMLLASIRDLIDKGVAPNHQKVLELKKQYNDLQAESDKVKLGNQGVTQSFMGMAVQIASTYLSFQALKRIVTESFNAYLEAESATKRLEAATKLTGNGVGEMSARLSAFASQLQKTSGYDEEMIQNLMSQAVIMGRTEEETKKLAVTASNLASAGIMPMEEAFESLMTTYDGLEPRNRTLKAMTGELTEEELKSGEAVRILSEKVAGMNEVMMDTTKGGITSMKNGLGELGESFGRAIADLIGKGGFKTLGDVLQQGADNMNKTLDLHQAGEALGKGTATLQQKLLILEDLMAETSLKIDDLYSKFKESVKGREGDRTWVQAMTEQFDEAVLPLQRYHTELTETYNALKDQEQAEKDLEEANAKKSAAAAAKAEADKKRADEALKQIEARKQTEDAYAETMRQIGVQRDNQLLTMQEASKKELEATNTLIDALIKLGFTGEQNGQIGNKAMAQAIRDREALIVLLESYKSSDEALAKSEKDAQEARDKAAKDELKNKEKLQAATEAAANSAAEYAKKTAELNATEGEKIEIDRQAAIEKIKSSEAAADAQELAIEKLNEYYDALKDKAAAKQFTENLKSAFGYAESALGALVDLFTAAAESQQEELDRNLEAQLAAIDERMQAELEANGVAEETELERLQRRLEKAKASGDEETAKELEQEIKRLQIKKKYEDEATKAKADAERQKAQLEYQAAMASWGLTLSKATAEAALAVIKCLPDLILAGITGGIGLIQVGAVLAQQPKPPAFQTGGMMLPSGKADGSLARVAEGGSSELMFNDSPQGQGFVNAFAAAVAQELAGILGGIRIEVPVYLNSYEIARAMTKESELRNLLISKRSIIG